MPENDSLSLIYGVLLKEMESMKSRIEALEKAEKSEVDPEKLVHGAVSGMGMVLDQRSMGTQAMIAMIDSRAEAAAERKFQEHEAKDDSKDRQIAREEAIKVVDERIKKEFDREERVEKEGTVETPDGVHKMRVVEVRRRS